MLVKVEAPAWPNQHDIDPSDIVCLEHGSFSQFNQINEVECLVVHTGVGIGIRKRCQIPRRRYIPKTQFLSQFTLQGLFGGFMVIDEPPGEIQFASLGIFRPDDKQYVSLVFNNGGHRRGGIPVQQEIASPALPGDVVTAAKALFSARRTVLKGIIQGSPR